VQNKYFDLPNIAFGSKINSKYTRVVLLIVIPGIIIAGINDAALAQSSGQHWSFMHDTSAYFRSSLWQLKINVFLQAINILIVNQSVIDICASFFTLLTAVVEVDGTHMSRDSTYDQFVCRMWLSAIPLWYFLVSSTYSIFLTTLDRYAAVVYYAWYHNNVRRMSRVLLCQWCLSINSIVIVLYTKVEENVLHCHCPSICRTHRRFPTISGKGCSVISSASGHVLLAALLQRSARTAEMQIMPWFRVQF